MFVTQCCVLMLCAVFILLSACVLCFIQLADEAGICSAVFYIVVAV